MEIYDNDLNAEIIGFGALNVDKLYSVARIVSHDEESFIKNEMVSNKKWTFTAFQESILKLGQ